MKNSKIYLLCTLLFLCTIDSFGQKDTIFSFNLKNVSIPEFANQIEAKSSYRVFYNPDIFDRVYISFNSTNKSIKSILTSVFEGSDIYFSIDLDNHIFLTKGQSLNFTINNKGNQNTGNKFQVDSTNDNEVLDGASLQSGTLNKLIQIGLKNPIDKRNTAVINGVIKNKKNGEPVFGASIFIDNPKIGVVSDQYGSFVIELPKGKNILHVQSLGMRDLKQPIQLNGDGKIMIDLTESVTSLKKVVISSQKISNIRGTQMGVQRIDIKTLKQVPVAFGESDILKVVTTIPGVKTVGEASSGLNVRGGSADQNLILFNDGTIYNPTHLFGLFSAFNPEVIKNVELYKGTIPAEYGGRLASVLEINSREGNKKNITGSAGIGLLTSRLNLEGPLVKDKSSFILGGRTTYSNWLFKLLPEEYKNSKASFYDVNFSINHEIDKKNTLYFSAYTSADQFNLNSDTLYGYGNKNFSLKLKHIYSNKLTGIYTVGYDKYSYNITSDKVPVNAFKLNFGIQQLFAKAMYNYTLNVKHSFDFGVNTLLYNLSPGTFAPLNQNSLVAFNKINTERALETALFFTDHYTISSKLKLDLGLRTSLYNYLGPQQISTYAEGVSKSANSVTGVVDYKSGDFIKNYGGPEFRIAMRYVVDETFSLKAGFNNQRQYIHSISNTTTVSPTDIWKLSDPNIRPQLGNQFSIGAYKNLKSNTIETSLEFYYKNINNFLDYKSGAVLLMNKNIETEVIGTKGKSYGVEFLVKKLTGKLNGWISYSWSRILLKTTSLLEGEIINKGAYYPANYDKPHDLSIISNYRFSHRFSISLNTTYSTGRPITIPVGLFNYGGSARTLYADRNAYRIPDYYRADFSMNIEGNHKVNQLTHNSWSIGVYNLTGRRNPYSVYFLSENGGVNGYQLSIFGAAIPYINFNIKFK